MVLEGRVIFRLFIGSPVALLNTPGVTHMRVLLMTCRLRVS